MSQNGIKNNSFKNIYTFFFRTMNTQIGILFIRQKCGIKKMYSLKITTSLICIFWYKIWIILYQVRYTKIKFIHNMPFLMKFLVLANFLYKIWGFIYYSPNNDTSQDILLCKNSCAFINSRCHYHHIEQPHFVRKCRHKRSRGNPKKRKKAHSENPLKD